MKIKSVIGEKGKLMREPEERIEIIYSANMESEILAALRASHPYEEIAYELIAIENAWQQVGSGMIGELEKPVPVWISQESQSLHEDGCCPLHRN